MLLLLRCPRENVTSWGHVMKGACINFVCLAFTLVLIMGCDSDSFTDKVFADHYCTHMLCRVYIWCMAHMIL